MNEDERLRARLQGLETPPARAGFEHELMLKIGVRQQVALRRWRLAALALLAVALAAITAAGVFAAASTHTASEVVVDRSYSCLAPATAGGGFGHLRLWAFVDTPRAKGSITIAVMPDPTPTDQNIGVIWANRVAYKSFAPVGYDPKACRPIRAQIPLARAGLPKDGEYTPHFLGGFDATCTVPPGRVQVRLRMALDRDGFPTRGTVAVRTKKQHTPLAFFDWSTARISSYLAPRCPT